MTARLTERISELVEQQARLQRLTESQMADQQLRERRHDGDLALERHRLARVNLPYVPPPPHRGLLSSASLPWRHRSLSLA